MWPVLLLVMLKLRVNRRMIAAALVLMIAALLYTQAMVLPGLTLHTSYFAPFEPRLRAICSARSARCCGIGA